MNSKPGNTPVLYDDPALFQAYDAMRMQDGTLNEVVEIPSLISLMPKLAGIAVADLGCGTGAMCRWLLTQGAVSVTGFDASGRMLSQAREQSPDTNNLHYVQADLEVLHLPQNSFDLILSSLALHYVTDFTTVVRSVSAALKPGGCFIFSVEHPVVTCHRREWLTGEDGTRSCWPVDHYLDEGPRSIGWMGSENVPRHHRMIASYVNSLLDAGLVLNRLIEPGPSEEAIARWPRLADQRRRPPFLLIKASRI